MQEIEHSSFCLLRDQIILKCTHNMQLLQKKGDKMKKKKTTHQPPTCTLMQLTQVKYFV